MARLKTDAERGPLGAWAYNTRDALDLSAEGVMGMLPTKYHPATLRKVEGRVADEKRVAIDPQPRLAIEGTEPTGSPDALVAALERQSSAIESLVVLLARREGITLHDLAEHETSLLGQMYQEIAQRAAREAIARDQHPEPEAPPQPGRKPRLLEPAKP